MAEPEAWETEPFLKDGQGPPWRDVSRHLFDVEDDGMDAQSEATDEGSHHGGPVSYFFGFRPQKPTAPAVHRDYGFPLALAPTSLSGPLGSDPFSSGLARSDPSDALSWATTLGLLGSGGGPDVFESCAVPGRRRSNTIFGAEPHRSMSSPTLCAARRIRRMGRTEPLPDEETTNICIRSRSAYLDDEASASSVASITEELGGMPNIPIQVRPRRPSHPVSTDGRDVAFGTTGTRISDQAGSQHGRGSSSRRLPSLAPASPAKSEQSSRGTDVAKGKGHNSQRARTSYNGLTDSRRVSILTDEFFHPLPELLLDPKSIASRRPSTTQDGLPRSAIRRVGSTSNMGSHHAGTVGAGHHTGGLGGGHSTSSTPLHRCSFTTPEPQERPSYSIGGTGVHSTSSSPSMAPWQDRPIRRKSSGCLTPTPPPTSPEAHLHRAPRSQPSRLSCAVYT